MNPLNRSTNASEFQILKAGIKKTVIVCTENDGMWGEDNSDFNYVGFFLGNLVRENSLRR